MTLKWKREALWMSVVPFLGLAVVIFCLIVLWWGCSGCTPQPSHLPTEKIPGTLKQVPMQITILRHRYLMMPPEMYEDLRKEGVR